MARYTPLYYGHTSHSDVLVDVDAKVAVDQYEGRE